MSVKRVSDYSKCYPIPEDAVGQRVDVVLKSLLPDYSRVQLSKWLKGGVILLNESVAKPKDKVAAGDIISVTEPLENLTVNNNEWRPADLPLTIIHEDDDLLVINKPVGLVVHPGAGNQENTLANALIHHYPQLQSLHRSGIVHRLDKETSGVMVIAKTLIAQTNLAYQFEKRLVKKQYYGLVDGVVISGDTIETGYGRDLKNRLKMAVLSGGRKAVTTYRVERRFLRHTLLDINILTGRTHQIRVHLSHIRHSLVGDPLYGHKPRFPKGASDELVQCIEGFKHQALHAYELELMHPTQKLPLSFNAPIPEDFKRLLDLLG